MVRIDKNAAARLGFGGFTADRHTTDRIFKKVQTKVKRLRKENVAAPTLLAPTERKERCELIKVSGSLHILDMDSLYD